MIEFKGKYSTAKVFNDNIDSETAAQIIEMCNQPFVNGKKIRIMPDTHAGTGCTIGTTMEVDDYIVPNWVGVDIACGMSFCRIPKTIGKLIENQLPELDAIIHKNVPCGQNLHEDENGTIFIDVLLNSLKCKDAVNMSRTKRSVGTLGGGNHFIELDKSEETGDYFLVVHCGSRNLGKQVAEHYQRIARNKSKRMAEEDVKKIQAIIERLKSEGRHNEINDALLAFKKAVVHKKYSDGMEPLIGSDLQDYLYDIDLVTKYAHFNRESIIRTILNKAMDILPDSLQENKFEIQETVHNYIEVLPSNKNGALYGILRKGAVSAKEGETLLIPMNMRDGSLLCVGKGNPDWNYSAPHGAGRVMSRSKAKEKVTLDEYEKSMRGIYSTSVCASTIDESPMTYKNAKEIEGYIQDTVNVKEHLKAIYNFKASEEFVSWTK